MIKKIALVSILFLLTIWLICSCSVAQEKTDQGEWVGGVKVPTNTDALELTATQEAAFDALNAIQIQEPGEHLYSTFSGIQHDCFPPDTSFTLSKEDLLVAIQELLDIHGTAIPINERRELSTAAVLAQDAYKVQQCFGESFKIINDTLRSVPTQGTWILPEILGRRDLVLRW